MLIKFDDSTDLAFAIGLARSSLCASVFSVPQRDVYIEQINSLSWIIELVPIASITVAPPQPTQQVAIAAQSLVCRLRVPRFFFGV